MAKLISTDDLMKQFLVDTKHRSNDNARDLRIEAENPGYLDERNYRVDPFVENDALFRDLLTVDRGRDAGEFLQDTGAGLLGTLGSIGNTAVLVGGVGVDALDHVVNPQNANWNATAQALENLSDTQEWTNSLKTEKSAAFDRVNQYRQEKAIEQAKLEGDGWFGQQAAAFGSAVTSYIDNPDQLLSEGIAQTPYILTGGIAKGITQGTKLANPLIAQLSKKMSVESAEKLVQMEIVGGLQGTIEGADAAASTYQRVMSSTDTFGPGDEAARETAALQAAAKAFAIAGSVSAVTGTLASKYELAPFGTKGGTAFSRSGDNLVKALQEGFQEAIESGTGVLVGNYAGNTVLDGSDVVALEQGLGGAVGTGLVVGAGSTVVTNPRSLIDAVGAPLSLLSSGADALGERAEARERVEDLAATNVEVDDIVANIPTATVDAVAPTTANQQPPKQSFTLIDEQIEALDEELATYGEDYSETEEAENDSKFKALWSARAKLYEERDALEIQLTEGEVTTDTPSEDVPLPKEMELRTSDGPIGQAVRTFATGMAFLRGKDMNSVDAVTAWHVLGAVMQAAIDVKSLRDRLSADATDQNKSPEEREQAKATLTKLKGLMSDELLDDWVKNYPMEEIDENLEKLKEFPEEFGRVVAHFARVTPLKLSSKMLKSAALESKSLSKDQRDSIALAQELKEAEAELTPTGKLSSEEVSRSMMQTGFPGYRENDSVAGYLGRITKAVAEGDMATAEIEFNRLVKFSNFELGRAAAYEAAKEQMRSDPDSKQIDLKGYFQLGDNGKLDKSKPQFVNKKSLDLVKIVRKDADAIAKMVAAIQKRTGLVAAKATETAPVVVKEPEVTVTPAKAETPAPASTKKTYEEFKTEREALLKNKYSPEEDGKLVALYDAYPEFAKRLDAEFNAAPAAKTKTETKDQEEDDLEAMSDDALASEVAELTAKKRRSFQDNLRYDNLVREQARRMPGSSDRLDKEPEIKPVVEAVAEAAPAAVAVSAEAEIVEAVPQETGSEAADTAVREARDLVRALLKKLNFKFVESPNLSLSELERIASKYLTGLHNDDPKFLDDAAKALSYALYTDINENQSINIPRDVIEKALREWLNTGKAPKISKTTWTTILQTFNKLMSAFKSKEFQAINEALEVTINKIKTGNDFTYKPKAGYAKLNFQREMDNNPLARLVLASFAKSGLKFKLTGSVAYADQVPVYRKENTPLHDVDLLFAKGDGAKAFDWLKKDTENWGGVVELYSWTPKGETTGAIVGVAAVPVGYEIRKMKILPFNTKHKQPQRGYTVHDIKTGEQVGRYFFIRGVEETFEGIAGITIDLMEDNRQSALPQTFKDGEGKEITISVSSYIGGFAAKLAMLRPKDVADFKAVVPPDVAPTADVAVVELAAPGATAEDFSTTEETKPKAPKNHFSTSLMPDGAIPEGATPAQQEQAKNQLANSFTAAEETGLFAVGMAGDLATPAAMAERLGTDESIIESLFELKNTVLRRMNERLAKLVDKGQLKALVNGKRFWSTSKFFSLHAAKWDENGIQFQKQIGSIMAWTGIQHMLDIVVPMKWSEEKKKGFVATYGKEILPMLEAGWVPLSDQIHQTADKLRRNLGLNADKTVSQTYTQGVLLSLATDSLASLFVERNSEGEIVQDGPLEVRQMLTKSKAKVNWVRVNAKDLDLMFDAAAALEPLFPDRSKAAAAIIGEPPTKVRETYRGTDQAIGSVQKRALKKMGETAHKLSPLMGNVWLALPKDALLYIFGYRPMAKDEYGNDIAYTLAEQAQQGLNQTSNGDYKVINNHLGRIKAHAEANDMEMSDVPSYFEHEATTNGRAMTVGTSPQSSKAYRDIVSNVKYTVNTKKANRGFHMAVAQGLGIKMDTQSINDSLKELETYLAEPSVQRALAAAGRMGAVFDYANNDDLLKADVNALFKMTLKGDPIELTSHGLSALVHMAKYQEAVKTGDSFVSSLAYEIDGKTDGPINLMMMMGLRGTFAKMMMYLGLGGLWFGDDPIAVQDMTQQLQDWHGGSKDLYEIIAKDAGDFNVARGHKMVNSARGKNREQISRMVNSIGRVMQATKMVKSFGTEGIKHSRGFTKKATQAVGYLQGETSIINDLANTMLESLSVLQGSGELSDELQADINFILSNKIGYSEKKNTFYVNELEEEARVGSWDGRPLEPAEFEAFVRNLKEFGGYGLAAATMKVVGYQRTNMMAAVHAINAHVIYAQEKLTELYTAKQNERVKAGLLLKGQALSSKDEKAIIRTVMEKYVPHPEARNTAGLPIASFARSQVEKSLVERLEMGAISGQYVQVSSAAFEDMGVSFAALFVMAGGDASMMMGFFDKHSYNALNMYDGIYINPEDIDEVGNKINKEVRENWNTPVITNILKSLPKVPDDFQEVISKWNAEQPKHMWIDYEGSLARLKKQEAIQKHQLRKINSRNYWVSHMAGHESPYGHEAEPLNSTTLGTSVTDPLLDLASDSLGHEFNGVRRMTAGDVKALLKDHTFENPVLSGLWKVLSPLISNDLTLFMSSDKQSLGEFYSQNERREMSENVDGVSVGNRVYIRAINAETIAHELLHATTKNLTATYFAQPEALTAQQRAAMANLVALQEQFMGLDAESLPPLQGAMVGHVQGIMRDLNPNSAMQEFLAYGLTNYHLQRTLAKTTSTLSKLLESIFNAVKALFGFPNGTQSDSMLAQMLSNFEALTADAPNVTYPVSVDDALNSINPSLARNLGAVLQRLVTASEIRSVNLETKDELGSATVRNAAQKRIRDRMEKISTESRTRMQQLADSGLFPAMSNEQLTAGEYIQAVFAAGLQLKAQDNALLSRVVDAVRDAGIKIWLTNGDTDLAQARFDYFFENMSSRNDRIADILAMAIANPEFAERMNSEILPRQKLEKDSLNNWLDSSAKTLYDMMDTGLALGRDASLGDALEVATLRIRKSLEQSAKRAEAKSNSYRKLTDSLTEMIQFTGKKVGEYADARLKLKGNKDWIGSGMMILAGTTNDRYADMLGNMVLGLTNQLDKYNPLREIIQEMVGTTSSNFKLIQLKGIAARMISAIRQSFREQVPVVVKSWFKDLNPEQDELLHTVIGKFALYSLSQDLKDRLPELLTKDGIDHAITDASRLLMAGGDSFNKSLMIAHAKRLGDRMANKGTSATYLNTQAIANLQVEGGAVVLNAAEMEALENLSTLQALSHLTPTQRRATLAIFRENTEGFWKTTVLINSFFEFDTRRAGDQTATLNFQKGWIPVESDGRKKLKLFHKSEVRAAERMGWVQVGEFKDDPSLVYMSTEVGKTPALSGGAIHAVDYHMNGIHFHSGMPIDPSIQTIIDHPKVMREIRDRIIKGEVVPYTALYDADGDVVGFQRLLDPALVDRHTKTVGRISDAAGIWLGRLHEEKVAYGQNQAAVNLLKDTWVKGKADGDEKEFVNIRQPLLHKHLLNSQDKVLSNVWDTLPYHTKRQLEAAFSDGSKEPQIWVKRSQINDAIGYHKASVGNFFTGDNRYQKSTNANVAALSRQILGKNAYKYMTVTEQGWQALIGTAKNTIIVKSLTVALNNLASNQVQLFMITGNPVWNLRVQAQKHKELVSYLGYQQRIARLTAEGLAINDPKAKVRIDAEQAQLKIDIKKLSIWPLIEAGELPTIAEGLSETEEFSLMGDLTGWLEKQIGRMPSAVGTVINNLAITKETSLYKGLDRMVQYGDFVAKATMYEWLTTQDQTIKKEAYDLAAQDKNPILANRMTMAQALHEVSLREVNDEFINYARLPGRWRTYGEDMGLLWFYNYKLRIMKMGFRRIRKNPAAFLIGAQVGSTLGIATLMDTMPWATNFAYSTGLDPLFTAHQTIFWNQLFN